jgi:insertion element IS1 protein InsB
VQQPIMAMSLNASGVRDTARGLHSSLDTVLREPRQKEAALASVNTALLRTLDSDEILMDMPQAGAAEIDEMWGFVGKQGNQRWLWHAIDHHTGAVLASVFGRRKDAVFVQRKALLEPCGITRSCTDGWGAYERHVEAEQHTVGKAHTQKIERTHLTLRIRITRFVRKTICLSQAIQLHDIVIGIFVHRYVCGLLLYSGHLHIENTP